MDAYDFRRGQYRRIYSSAKYGQRINRVSDFAARLLGWGLIPITDDFGNFSGNPVIVKSECFPLLERTVQQIDSAIRELQAEKLIGLYALGSEQFLHIHGHLHLQPAAANGRRVRRWPPSPWDAEPDLSPDSPSDCGILGNPGEPGKSGGQQTTTITTTKTTSSSAAQKSKGNTLPSPYPLGKSAAAAAEIGIDRENFAAMRADFPLDTDWPGIFAAAAARAKAQPLRNPCGLCRVLAKKGFSPPISRKTPAAAASAAADQERKSRAAREAQLSAAAATPEEIRALAASAKATIAAARARCVTGAQRAP